MKHCAYIVVLVMCQLVWGQMFDPPPLNPDPFALEAGKPAPRRQVRPVPGSENQKATGKLATVPADRYCGPLVERGKTRVAVLGYHNFSYTRPVSDMLLRTTELREQMECLRREKITVISMPEFLEWLLGERRLPERCVLITLDDGWRSVYTDAYPIFREYGYPFHLFLYTRYLSGRGDSMSPAMIREMMANGATIGSHSATHPYPSTWQKHEKAGVAAYTAFINKEIGGSRLRLQELFGAVNTYCYPGGYNDDAMVNSLSGHGYVAAFTVIPHKVTTATDPLRIDRYMVFGTDSSIFRRAVDFRSEDVRQVSAGTQPGQLASGTPVPPFPVTPRPGEIVPCQLPVISARLDSVADLDFSSVRMFVSGFGRVPARMDAATRTIQWSSPCRIYMPYLSVHVSWKTTDGTRHHAEWSFSTDRNVNVEQ